MYGICILHGFANWSLENPANIPTALELVPSGYIEILYGCLLDYLPSSPTFHVIPEDDVFQYSEEFTDKTAREIFSFFKGLKTIITYFSEVGHWLLVAEGQFIDEVVKLLKPVRHHVKHLKILRAYLDRTDVIVNRLPQMIWIN
jgi:hypothetical protein